MTNKECIQLFGKILGLDRNHLRAEVECQLASEDMDWIVFTMQANQQLIIPALYYSLKKHQLISLLPEELSFHMKDIFFLNDKRNTAIFQQIEQLCLWLNSIGVCPMLLKGGGYLLSRLYPHNAVRIMTDLDVLVSDNEFLKSAHFLEAKGYKSELDFNALYTSIYQAKDYPRLFKPGTPADVEIHRLPVAKEYIKHYGYAEAMENSCLHKYDFEAYTMSDENSVLLNFIHSQLTDKAHYYGYLNLKHMFDLLLLSGKTDVEKCFKTFGHYQKQAMAYWGATQILFLGKCEGGIEMRRAGEKYLRRVYLFLENPGYYQWVHRIKYLLWRIVYSYVKFPMSAIVNADNRRLLLKKLSAREWYTHHMQYLKSKM